MPGAGKFRTSAERKKTETEGNKQTRMYKFYLRTTFGSINNLRVPWNYATGMDYLELSNDKNDFVGAVSGGSRFLDKRSSDLAVYLALPSATT